MLPNLQKYTSTSFMFLAKTSQQLTPLAELDNDYWEDLHTFNTSRTTSRTAGLSNAGIVTPVCRTTGHTEMNSPSSMALFAKKEDLCSCSSMHWNVNKDSLKPPGDWEDKVMGKRHFLLTRHGNCNQVSIIHAPQILSPVCFGSFYTCVSIHTVCEDDFKERASKVH